MSARLSYSIVIPTIGRSSLSTLLRSLPAACAGAAPSEVFVVDDRADAIEPLDLPSSEAPVRVLRSHGRGPAAARNVGWRAASGPWIAFLDDDVIPPPGWGCDLRRDLAGLDIDVGASQGRIRVPLPSDRRPTDWERNVQGLEHARWATADMAYRHHVLDEVGGFDERFPRAFREDADLGLRVTGAGYRIVRGRRHVDHPVRPADRWVSIRLERGNADDVLMAALHGRDWRRRAGAERGRNGRHLTTLAAAAVAVAGAVTRRRSAAVAGLVGWVAGYGELAWTRLHGGPLDRAELKTVLTTSAVLPMAAVSHRVRGLVRLPRLLADTSRAPSPSERPLEAVLFDRDGTLVVDVPYNGEPASVSLMPGARDAVQRARWAGLKVGVVTNQSGIARGSLDHDQVAAVNRRVDELLGPFDVWAVCPHGPSDGCGCRKPAPGLVTRAAADLGVDPAGCAVIGDTAADIGAAEAANALGVLVPNAVTRREEVLDAHLVAPDLVSAVDLVLGMHA